METQKQETRAAAPVRRRRKAPETKENIEIQYTQPKIFSRKNLVMQLLTVAAVVLAITIGISVFFKVKEVRVVGASRYSATTVVDASGVEKGENLLFFGRGGAAHRILKKLPYVKDVRFQVELPGTVNIIIEEKPIAYVAEAEDGSLWLLTADGVVVEKAEENSALPKLTGVSLSQPKTGQQAVAAEPNQEQDAPIVVTAADRLQAALNVMQQLENNEFFSDVTLLDVADLFDLQIQYGTYRIILGDAQELTEKISAAKTAVKQLGKDKIGVLTLSKGTENWQVVYQSWNHE